MLIGGITVPIDLTCNHYLGQTQCGWCDLGYEPPPDGILHYRLYSQDGKFIEMTCQNTKDMRRFCTFIRERDRYGNSEVA